MQESRVRSMFSSFSSLIQQLCSDIRRGKNDSSVLSDLSNISSNSTMDNTQTKKIAALAKFKQLDIDITPRAALREFNQANQSDAQTPALYVPPRKKKTEAESGPSTAAAKTQGESPAGDLRDVLSDLSSDESSLADTKSFTKYSSSLPAGGQLIVQRLFWTSVVAGSLRRCLWRCFSPVG